MMRPKEEFDADDTLTYEELRQRPQTEIEAYCPSRFLPGSSMPHTEPQPDSSVSRGDVLVPIPKRESVKLNFGGDVNSIGNLTQPEIMEQPIDDPLSVEFDITMENPITHLKSEQPEEKVLRASTQDSHRGNSSCASEIRKPIIIIEQLAIGDEQQQQAPRRGLLYCSICSECIGSTKSYERHMRIHTGEKPFTCRICNESFRLAKQLTKHSRMHPNELRYECDHCGTRFKIKQSLRRHVRTHVNERSFSCDTCGKSFIWSYDLKNHARTHTGEKPYACQICNKTFTRKDSLTNHVYVTHVRANTCNICGQEFKIRSALKEHYKTHAAMEELFTCNVCGISFGEESGLSKHSCSTKNAPDSCSIPSQVLRRKENLALHIDSLHSGELYRCSTCGKSFKRKKYLVRHSKLHKREEFSSCPMCGRAFPDDELLGRHMIRHTKEKPFYCDMCGRSYKEKKELKQHVTVHMMGSKRFRCQKCGKSFSNSSNLTKHMQLHSSDKVYSCDICRKEFGQSQLLKSHKLIHSNEKPHKCHICGKSFARKDSLKEHVLRVHPERLDNVKRKGPFLCTVCNLEYKLKHNLEKHMKTQHSRELDSTTAATAKNINPASPKPNSSTNPEFVVRTGQSEIKIEPECGEDDVDMTDHKPQKFHRDERAASPPVTEILGI